MFTYPYFSFNLSISGYLLTFLTMMAVSLSVSVLTARIKQQEQIRLEAEKEKLRAICCARYRMTCARLSPPSWERRARFWTTPCRRRSSASCSPTSTPTPSGCFA